MNRINTIMVYVVIAIWTGFVLLHGISKGNVKTFSSGDGQGNINRAESRSPAGTRADHRLDSLTPLYY